MIYSFLAKIKWVIDLKILITGTLSGLGYYYAKKFSKRGHIVYAGVKNKKQLKLLEEKSKQDKIILFPRIINLDDDFEVFDDLDCIILQAGIGEGGSILEIGINRFRNNYEVNVIDNLKIIKKYLQFCLEYNKKGKIFITSSLAAFLPFPYLASYTSSKMNLYTLSKTLRYELWYQKIPVSVSVILPGSYKTGFNEVMIDNKFQDKLILTKKAFTMSNYQKLFFNLTEKTNYDSLSDKVVKFCEAKHSPFIITAPFSQALFVKVYWLFSIFRL